MATFDNGWICKKCWKANRDEDTRCYRCKAPHPDLAEMREPATGMSSLRRPVLQPFKGALRAAVTRVGSAPPRALGRVRRTARAGADGVAFLARQVARAGVRVGGLVVHRTQTIGRAAGVVTLSAGRAAAEAVHGGVASAATSARSGARATFRRLATLRRLPSTAASKLGTLARRPVRLLRDSAPRSHLTR
jgi:hypothetical protein